MRDFFRNYWLVSRDFWSSKAGLVALLILAVCVVFEFTSVGLSVYLNYWYVAFYNAVEQYDKQTLLRQLVIFAAITSVMLLNSFLAYFYG